MHRIRPHRDTAPDEASAILAEARCADLLSLYTRGAALMRVARASALQMMTIGSFVSVIVRALESRGVRTAQLLEELGIRFPPRGDALDRVPFTAVAALLDAAVRETNDPYFGLFAADFMNVTSLHALGYTLLASGSLRDLCTRVTRHFAFVGQSAAPRFDEAKAELEFVRVTELPPLTDDILGLFFTRLVASVSAGAVRPLEVALHRPALPDGERHRKTFGCPVRFGVLNTTFRFDPALLDRPFAGASPELAEHNEKLLIAHRVLRGDSVDATMSLTETAYLLGLADRERFSSALRCWTDETLCEHRARARRLPIVTR